MRKHANAITIEGRRFVLVPAREYDRLRRAAGLAQSSPRVARATGTGASRPAVETMRAIMARDVVRDRQSAGLTQKQLADLAGLRLETVNRIEAGKHTPSVASMDKIVRALKSIAKRSA
jgi:DNA-binding XRE family transcriptional regulator